MPERASVIIELEPFKVPNFVRLKSPPVTRGEGFNPRAPIPLSDLDATTLMQLCDEFTQAVFDAAGKQRP